MNAIIFDLDGVLVDSMPTHVRAWQDAFQSVAGIRVSAREIYLLEGMRGMELIQKIFEQKGADQKLAEQVQEVKNRVFKEIRIAPPFDGVPEMLDGISCPKAVVSGSGKDDVESILKQAFGAGRFDAVITADDVQVGKPHPGGFLAAAERLGVMPADTSVVENAPLGAAAASRAGMNCYVVLNDTPLAPDDFGTQAREKIFSTTRSLARVLEGSCR